MTGHGITQQNFKASTILVYTWIRDRIESSEDGRAACAARYAGEDLDLTEKVVRNAMKQLRTSRFIDTETRSRLYTMVTLCNRGKGAEKGAEKGAGKLRKNQYDLIEQGAEKGAEKGDTGVTAVRRSSGVGVVVNSVRKEVRREDPPTPQIVHKSKPTAKTRYEEAVARAPDLPVVVTYIDRLYAEISRNQKYPWVGNPWASTTLSNLIASYGAPLMMAAAERFFVRGHKWTEERAWAIDELARQFARLIAAEGTTKRAATIRVNLQDGHRPITPRETLAAQAIERLRQEKAFDDSFDPAEVRFGEEFRAMRQKVAT